MANIFLITALTLIIIVIVITYLNSYNYFTRENFDQFGNEFVPVGQTRYGLRGDRLNRIYVGDYYVRPDQQIKLNGTDGFTWTANMSPIEQGNNSCSPVPCPKYDYDVYDNQDVCYKCDNCSA